MPPKASSVRRQLRIPSREPEDVPSSRTTSSPFQKPHLPVLKATPSSRRQYSYGAAAEPLPSRPGHGLQRGQVLDLNNAVRNALIRHDQDELNLDAPSTSGAPSESPDPEEDELAGAPDASPEGEPRAQASAPTFAVPQGAHMSDGTEVEENRSFAIESDYYGDATIASSPGSLPPRQATRALAAAGATLIKAQPLTTPFLRSHRLQPAQGFFPVTRSKPAAAHFPPQTFVKPATARREAAEREDESDVEDEAEMPFDLRRAQKTNTPAPRKMQAAARNSSAHGPNGTGPATPPESEFQMPHQTSVSAAHNLGTGLEGPGRRHAGEQSAFVDRAREVASKSTELGNEIDPDTGRWLSGATKATAFLNHEPTQKHDEPHSGSADDIHADTVLEDEPAINWWQLLNPWTYARATAWMVQETGQGLVDWYGSVVSAKLRRCSLSATQIFPRFAAGVLVLALGLALLSAAMTGLKAHPLDAVWSPEAGGAHWYSLGSIARRIGDSLPTFSSSSRSRWDDMMSSWEANDPRHSDIDDYLQKIEQAFRQLTEAGKLHDASLEKLEAVVPKVVHMRLKDGKPTVAPEFWHALRDLIRADGSFLTLDKKDGDYVMSSERQWKAIATRLVGDAAFADKLNVSMKMVENKLDGRMTLWETWVRENEAKVQQSLGSALDQIKSAGSQREWDERLDKTVKGQLSELVHQGRFVGRDEYLRLVQAEVATHVSEFRAELAELQPQLKALVRESVDLAKADMPASMSSADVTALVHGLVRKAFADVNLEALAKGKIHAHWDTELRNQVNYFSPAAGAIVNPKLTSATYDPSAGPYSIREAGREGVRAMNPPVAALLPWHDDGDCWCAARSHNRRGNPHGAVLGVQLGYRVVPQHVVLEHILPGATTEPGARPRQVELYAAIDDAQVRERVRDFAAAHLPASPAGEDSVDGWNYQPIELPDAFALVGRFVYAAAELHGGVHVHRLSTELLALGADTDHVVVRAVSNHGAANHTCFYRVRLYGHNVELADGDDGPAAGDAGWQ